jgi:hypothetical protein
MQGKGLGWVMFSWVVLFTAGIMSIIHGVLALGNSSFWTTQDYRVVFSDLHTWAWIVIVLGVVELLAAASVWKGGSFGRYFGIFAASIALINWLFWIPIQPGWALIASAMAMMVIYGLAVYGGQGFED